MTPGIFETVFPRPTLAETMGAVAAAGFRSVQFHPPSAGINLWAADADPNAIDLIRRARDDSGVRIAALDGTYNMAHPHAEIRAEGHRGLVRTIELAEQLDVPFVTLCTGTRDPDSMWRHHPDNGLDDAWIDMTGAVTNALSVALQHDVTLLVEPEPANIVSSAIRAWTLLDQMADAHLKIVLDPANIVLSDRSRPPLDVLTESFDVLGSDIVLAHAKDLGDNDEFCPAGTGIVPWADYWSLLGSIGYEGDVIFHTLTEADVEAALGISPWRP
ncbi:MAG TPA: sugar phosphate isomerase/epimerase [Thermomicrobiales bacterium]|nr:sugar phosphate isomerase/epimerase [Thermomicrobiales bacterium]